MNSNDHDMQLFTPVHLQSHLKGLFDVPSKNIESAFELLLGLITQQSSEITKLKKSHRESLERNDEFKCQIERYDNQLLNEKINVATEFEKLKKDYENLLASHEKTLFAVGNIQEEITNLSFYIHGISDEHQNSVESIVQDSFVHVQEEVFPVSEDHVTEAEDSPKGMCVASPSSSSTQSQSKEVVINNGDLLEDTCTNPMDDSNLHLTSAREIDHAENEAGPISIDIETYPTLNNLENAHSNHVVDRKASIESRASVESKRHSTKSHDSTSKAIVSEEKVDDGQTTPDVEGAHVLEDPQPKQESAAYHETCPKNSVSPRVREAKNRFFGIVRAKRLASDQTVAARLNRLERSLSEMMPYIALNTINQEEMGTQATSEVASSITMRLAVVEHFLQGFDRIDKSISSSASKEMDAESKIEKNGSKKIFSDAGNAGITDDAEYQLPNSIGDENQPVDPNDSEVGTDSSLTRDWSLVQSDSTTDALIKSHSLLSHLNERDNRTESTIEDLARQIADLKLDLRNQEKGSSTTDASVTKVTEGLQKELSDVLVKLQSKVSNEEFMRETQSIRDVLKHCRTSHETVAVETSVDDQGKLSQLFEQIDELAETKLNKDESKQLLEKKEATIRCLVEGELSKQQLYISSNFEKFTNDLTDVRSMIDSRIDSIARLLDGYVSPPNIENARIQSGSVDEMIQQATHALRESLEESFTKKIEELKFIEDELDGLVSQLAEKPSQAQIQSMLQNLEANMFERIGQDNELQLLIENLKQDMSQRMTRGEVVKLIENVLKKAKQEIQNTKDTLMIGRIPYKCIGCNQAFPEGVNGARAPKVNHDSLPPSQGFNVPPILHPANKKSLRPLQTRRSVQIRPNTTIIGGSFVSKYSFQGRNNSR
ncbi:hypothetical protein HJC23_009950 [Cyclotella cryptica]|uniref:Uncharacterized protein n=1 Tax=Cyclotella cryptica TaxID=29204 RepID=A0ABD3QER7_9STRA